MKLYHPTNPVAARSIVERGFDAEVTESTDIAGDCLVMVLEKPLLSDDTWCVEVTIRPELLPAVPPGIGRSRLRYMRGRFLNQCERRLIQS